MAREEIRAFPQFHYSGPVYVINTLGGLRDAVARLKHEALLGFDVETRPAFQKGESYPPALLQLAAADAVYIFQLRHVPLAQGLRHLLAQPNIIKAGVALDRDISDLQGLAPFLPAGFVDLGATARRAGIKNHGLRGLAAVLLRVSISKGAQRTNWARHELTPGQVTYAATDAWIGRELYKFMAAQSYLGAPARES